MKEASGSKDEAAGLASGRARIFEKRQIVPTLNSLHGPLPRELSSLPFHKIQGAALQAAASLSPPILLLTC